MWFRRKGVLVKILTLWLITMLVSGCATSVVGGNSLTVNGRMEVKEVDINSKIPGKVIKVHVSEGKHVKSGDVLAEISSEELKAKEDQAKALVEAAKTQLDQANISVKLHEELAASNILKAKGAVAAANSQLEKAKAGARKQEVAQAQAAYDLMLTTFERVEKLYKKGAVPAQKFDEVKMQLEVAKQRLSIAEEGARQEDIKGAEGTVRQAEAALQAADAGALQIKLAKQSAIAAQAKYDQAKAGLEEVRAYLKDTVIRAPIDGVVTTKECEEGELISTGMPLFVVSNLDNQWVEVKVRESALGQVKLNQEVTVEISNVDTEKKKLKGKVVKIAQKPDFATKRATNDKGDQDILAFGVKVELLDKTELLHPGMSVNVTFTEGAKIMAEGL